MPPAGIVIGMAFAVISRGNNTSSVGTFIPVMLWRPRLTAVSFNSLPLYIPILSFLIPLQLSWILRLGDFTLSIAMI